MDADRLAFRTNQNCVVFARPKTLHGTKKEYMTALLPQLGRPRLFRSFNLALRSTYSIHKARWVSSRGHIRKMESIINSPRDPNTLSNYNNWVSTHVTANLDILFDQQKLVGNVIHKLKSITNGESRGIILDTNHLDIGEVKVNGKPSEWELLPRLEPYGNGLKIKLDSGVALEEIVEVDVCSDHPLGLHDCRLRLTMLQISIKTTDKCTALQWLTPAQTSNKKHPYMCK